MPGSKTESASGGSINTVLNFSSEFLCLTKVTGLEKITCFNKNLEDPVGHLSLCQFEASVEKAFG